MSLSTALASRQTPPGHRRLHDLRIATTGYGFLLPSAIGVVFFLVIPVLLVIGLSFLDWNLISPPTFVGLANYRELFSQYQVVHALFITALYVLLNIPLQTVLSLLLAMLLTRKLPGMGFFRTLYVIPYLATPVALGIVWTWIFDPSLGAVNQILATVGIHGPQWLSSPHWALPVIAGVNVWQYAGYNMLFFAAGLGAIPKQLYEAASLDGASKFRQFFRISLPLLTPTLLFVLITNVIGSFQIFDAVYVMTQGGPGNSTGVINYEIYQNAFVYFHIGAASAMAIVLFLLILVFTILQYRYLRRRTTYDFS